MLVRDKKKGNTPEIDAIAESNEDRPLAIEHTRIESFYGQMMDDSRIESICIPLENEIAHHTPNGITCFLPTLAFVKGFDWNTAANALKSFLVREAPSLKIGLSIHSVPDVPFDIRIYSDPQKNSPFRIGCKAPGSKRIGNELLASMETALFHKWERLNDYSKDEYIPTLIVESNDANLMDHTSVYQAFLNERGGDIWS